MVKQEDDTRLSLASTLLAVPSIGVFFLSDILNWGLSWQGDAPRLAEINSATVRLDASGRLLMLAAALAGFGLAYLIVLRFVADLLYEFGPRTRAWILGWYTGGVLLGALWVLTGWMQVSIDAQFGKDFFRNSLRLLGTSGGAKGDTLLRGFETLVLCSRLVLMLAAGIVVTGGVSSLVEPVRPIHGDEACAFLINQRRRLASYINLAAALLVVSLVFQVAWMRWPLVALDPATATMLARQVDASAVLSGVTGSVVIALFAVPASAILAARVAAVRQVSDADPAAPLLTGKLLPTLGKVLVILAPTLAGSLPTILDALAKLAEA